MSGDTLYWAYFWKDFIEVCLIGAAALPVIGVIWIVWKLGKITGA